MLEIYQKYKKYLPVALGVLAAILIVVTLALRPREVVEEQPAEPEHKLVVYGIVADSLTLETGEVGDGQTMGGLLGGFGVSAQIVDKLNTASKEIFPLNKVRAGNRYTAFLEEDTAGLRTLRHLAYEKNAIDYVVFNFMTDSVSVVEGVKEVTTIRERDTVTITSSLWGAIMAAGLPFELAAEMEDIYQWSIDFFSIQKGDRFTVIYDRQMVDTVDVGLGRVWGAEFVQGGKSYYAIPFKQGEKIQYWDEQGNSLRKALLKAPLKYSRISSRFTYRRLHPVHRVYRAHTGVDYAAPSGTPVVAVADGVVVFKGWGGGGGNTLKIKHAGNLQSGYLHLRGYAKGIKQGSRVSQGDVIGYVGSTGTSTGPHLDFRLWRNGTPIDPLKVPSEPSEPIKKENVVPFEYVRERIMAELRGDSIAMEDMIVQLDSLPVQPQLGEEPIAAATKEEKR
ncbi:MAG: peptidoglycan DD-metalloendopeptidase family protein [Rikenellaceae bacterium]|nr:peptidoglycan DD-metalloendopeptidase family protein [Rikenellaceae bacterium]